MLKIGLFAFKVVVLNIMNTAGNLKSSNLSFLLLQLNETFNSKMWASAFLGSPGDFNVQPMLDRSSDVGKL